MIDVSWPQAVPALLAALLLVAAPGLALTAPLRAPVLVRLGACGPASIALVGVAGIIANSIGIAFVWWHPLAVGVAAGAIVALLRRWMALPTPAPARGARAAGGETDPRQSQPRRPRSRFGGIAVVVGAWLLASAAIAVLAFCRVPQASLFAQTYDNIFHINAVMAILDTGDASSLHLRALIQTDTGTGFYPAGWHALVASAVQLTGTTVATAANAVWIAVAAVVWLPGLALLARAAVQGSGRAHAATVTATAVIGGSCFAVFPFLLLPWGTLYPNFVAYAATPAALALLVLVLNRWFAASSLGCAGLDGGGRTRGWAYAALLGAALLGVTFGQPRSLVSVALLAAPLLAGAAWRWARSRWRAGGHSRRMMLWLVGCTVAAVAVVGFAAVLLAFRHFEVFGSRPISDHLNGPQSRAWQGIPVSIWQLIAQAPLLARPAEEATPALLLAAAVLAALVWGWRRPSTRWLVWAYALTGVLFVLAAGSDSVLAKLATGLWYKDKFRISALLPIAAIPLLAGGVAAFMARASKRARRGGGKRTRSELVRRITAGGIAAAVVITSWSQLSWGGPASTTGQVFSMPSGVKGVSLASRPMLDFFATTVRSSVPEGEMVLGDPWDGSALTWAFAGSRPVFPHVNGQWDPDRALIMAHLDEADTDPAVCEAVRRLGVHYLVYNPGEFGGGDPAGNLFAGIHRAVEAGLFTEVARDGENALYRMDICS